MNDHRPETSRTADGRLLSGTAGQSRPNCGRLRAALTLALLTTVCAELTFTAVAVPFTWLLLPLLMVMYGAGVLVIREAAVRVGAGWPSLILLALAYQLAEDGVGLQALTSPSMYAAADWGWRVLGANVTYWQSQVGVHVVFSVLIPIMLTNLMFPNHHRRPYLRGRGFAVAGVLAVIGVLGLRTVVSATEDPGYHTPWPWTAGFLCAIAALAWVALRVLPGRPIPHPLSAGQAPKPVTAGIAAAAATVVFLSLLLPPGLGTEYIFGDNVPQYVPFTLAAMAALGSGWLLLRWQAVPNWTNRHRIWLAGGVLTGHTAFVMPASTTAIVAGSITVAVEVTFLVILAHHLGTDRDSRHR